MVKKKCAIFISGTGSNLNKILLNSRDYNFPIKIELIISNKKDAVGNKIAKKFKIPIRFINTKKFLDLNLVLNILKQFNITLVCLAGFMRILPAYFIKKFSGKIINIHPSLLPKYKGLNAFDKILKNKEKRTGSTVHYVNENLDSGKIILKKWFYLKKDYTVNKIEILNKKIEHKLYSEAIIKILRN